MYQAFFFLPFSSSHLSPEEKRLIAGYRTRSIEEDGDVGINEESEGIATPLFSWGGGLYPLRDSLVA